MKSDENLEVLRCWLMLLIVLGHVASFLDGIGHDTGRMIHAFQVYAVDAFALLSGWFGIRFSFKKIIRLLGLAAYVSVLLLCLSRCVVGSWCFSYKLGWYGNAYLALMCVSPIINAGIEHLRQESETSLCDAWRLYAIMIFVSWLPIDGFGIDLSVYGWQAHSMNTLMFM